MGVQPGRSVIYEQQFEDELVALGPDVRRVEEARRYLDWILSQRPDVGINTEYPGVLTAPLKLPLVHGASLHCSAFYIYDDERVNVLSIKPAPPR